MLKKPQINKQKNPTQHSDHFRLPKECISVAKKDLKLSCFHVQRSELAQHTTACSALTGAAHKSSHAPKKRLQRLLATSPAIIHCYKIISYYSNRASAAWFLEQMGWIQQEAQGRFFWVFGFWVFLLQQRRSQTGRGQDWVWRRAEDRNNRSSHPWPCPGFIFPGEQKPWMQEPEIIKKLHFDGSSGPAHGVPCGEIGRQKDKSAQGRPG